MYVPHQFKYIIMGAGTGFTVGGFPFRPVFLDISSKTTSGQVRFINRRLVWLLKGSVPMEFISTARPNRPDFLATMTSGERAVMGEHMAYTGKLFREGRIVIGGAATDGSLGIIIYRVNSPEEARDLFDNDPLVKAEIAKLELHPFRTGVLSGERIEPQ